MTLLSLVPFNLEFIAKRPISSLKFGDIDFMQPVEILKGQCLCDFFVDEINIIES